MTELKVVFADFRWGNDDRDSALVFLARNPVCNSPQRHGCITVRLCIETAHRLDDLIEALTRVKKVGCLAAAKSPSDRRLGQSTGTLDARVNAIAHSLRSRPGIHDGSYSSRG